MNVNEVMTFSTDENGGVTEIRMIVGVGGIAISGGIITNSEGEKTPFIGFNKTKKQYNPGDVVFGDPDSEDKRFPTIILNFLNEDGLDVLQNAVDKTREYLRTGKFSIEQ